MTRPRAAWAAVGQDRMLVRGPRPAGRADCAGLKAGRDARTVRAVDSGEAREELLNWINVFPGEMIYVAGGTVHTLGPGAIIVETQQQSDTTYRLYDYGRPRELHLKEGLAVIKRRRGSGKVVRPAPSKMNGGDQSPLAADRRAVLRGGQV